MFKEQDEISNAIRKEMRVEPWVYITIETPLNGVARNIFHHYDLPREMYEKYNWVIRWRVAKIQCQHPRKRIIPYYCFYNKKIGKGVKINELQSKIIAAKAQITRQRNRVNEYLEYNRQNNMFFDEATDEQLIKINVKFQTKEANLKALELQMVEMLKKEMPPEQTKPTIKPKRKRTGLKL